MVVSKAINQIKQVWIALSFKITSTKLTQSRNAFYSYLQAASLVPAKSKSPSKSPAKTPTKSPSKISTDALVESFIAKPIQAVKFLLEVFTAGEVSAYLDLSKIAQMISKLG